MRGPAYPTGSCGTRAAKDVFADERGTIRAGVHFGSRGFGHNVASGFLSMSRTAARSKVNCRTGEVKSPGAISWEMLREWIGLKQVI